MMHLYNLGFWGLLQSSLLLSSLTQHTFADSLKYDSNQGAEAGIHQLLPRQSTTTPLPGCAYWYQPENTTTCEQILSMFRLSVTEFVALNPQESLFTDGTGCYGYRTQRVVYCVQALPPPRVSTDGECGPDKNGAVCPGSSFGGCCSVTGWCGSGYAHCGIGNCIDGNCWGGTGWSTDGTCGNRADEPRCGGQYGVCCSINKFCGNTTDHCAKDKCIGGACEGKSTTVTLPTTTTTRPSTTSPTPCQLGSASACPTVFNRCCQYLCAKAGVPFRICQSENETGQAVCVKCGEGGVTVPASSTTTTSSRTTTTTTPTPAPTLNVNQFPPSNGPAQCVRPGVPIPSPVSINPTTVSSAITQACSQLVGSSKWLEVGDPYETTVDVEGHTTRFVLQIKLGGFSVPGGLCQQILWNLNNNCKSGTKLYGGCAYTSDQNLQACIFP